jgi:STE24 endopeptidase
VFLSDGLIARLTAAEIEAVFGHELGHIRHRHLLLRGLAVVAPLCLFFAAETLWPGPMAAGQAMLGGLDRVAQLLAAVGVSGGLLGYLYFVFGGYSRLMETEADLYGCRVLEEGGVEDASGVFISGLEKLALECGADREKSTWQHPSIARRTEFLAAASAEPELATRFARRVRWMNRLFVAAVLSPVIVAVFC